MRKTLSPGQSLVTCSPPVLVRGATAVTDFFLKSLPAQAARSAPLPTPPLTRLNQVQMRAGRRLEARLFRLSLLLIKEDHPPDLPRYGLFALRVGPRPLWGNIPFCASSACSGGVWKVAAPDGPPVPRLLSEVPPCLAVPSLSRPSPLSRASSSSPRPGPSPRRSTATSPARRSKAPPPPCRVASRWSATQCSMPPARSSPSPSTPPTTAGSGPPPTTATGSIVSPTVRRRDSGPTTGGRPATGAATTWPRPCSS